jgi:ABC-type polysaccharide/polyol phosphate export permease
MSVNSLTDRAPFGGPPECGSRSWLRWGHDDLGQAWQRVGTAAYFAWGEIRSRYSRSVLGPLWLLLNTSVSVACLSVIYSLLLHQDPGQMVPLVTVGLVVWQWLAACVSEASATFTRNAHYIRNIPGPLSSFLLILLLRQAMILAHHLIVVLVVFALFPPTWGWSQLLVLPGLALVVANLAWVCLVLAVTGARFRDLEHTVAAIMPLLFLISPVIYRPDLLAGNQWLVWVNPFSYLIALIRDPLLGASPPPFVAAVASGMALVGGLAATLLLGRFRNQIPFWV